MTWYSIDDCWPLVVPGYGKIVRAKNEVSDGTCVFGVDWDGLDGWFWTYENPLLKYNPREVPGITHWGWRDEYA